MKNKNKNKKIQQTNLMFQVFLWSELSPKHSAFMRKFNKDNANLEKQVFFLINNSKACQIQQEFDIWHYM